MIKAVLFDLYETLITESEAAPPRGAKLGPALGLDYNAFRKEWKLLRPQIVRGHLTFRDALMEIGRKLGGPLDPARVQAVCDERVRAKAEVFRRVQPDLVTLSRDLSNHAIRLAVVSNCWAEDVMPWPACALAPHFSATVFSFELRAAKPDPAIYLEATRRLGVDPADALYIGDGGDDELAGAERAGLRAAQAMWFIESGAVAPPPPGIPQLHDPREVLGRVAAV